MSLTSGRGPLTTTRAGWFVPPVADGTVYVEPFPRRVRAEQGGRIVLDTERVLLVHRPGGPPSYAFRPEDVGDLPTQPEPAAPAWVQVPWSAVDAWYEEEERVHLHPSNPYHRVQCLPSRRRLQVIGAGEVLVDTTDTVAVHETALAPRLYVARQHVRMDLLVPSPTVTHCPSKGTASYLTLVVGSTEVPDVAWSYEDAMGDSAPVRAMVCFDDTKVDVRAAFPPAPAPPW